MKAAKQLGQDLDGNKYKLNLFLGKSKLKQVIQEKLLGCVVDENLSWTPQIRKVRQTILYKLSILRKIKKICSAFRTSNIL